MCCMDFDSFVPYQLYYFKYGPFDVKTYVADPVFGHTLLDIYAADFEEPRENLIELPSACTDILLFHLEDGSRECMICHGITEPQVICFDKRITAIVTITLSLGIYNRMLGILLEGDYPVEISQFFDTLTGVFDYDSFKQKEEMILHFFQEFCMEKKETRLDCLQEIIYRYMRGEFSISIENIASDIGFSSRNLRYILKDYIGISPKEFCELLRLQKAYILIEEAVEHREKVKLCEIAYKCGYYDQAHMSKKMKIYLGVSPSKMTQMISEDYCYERNKEQEAD